LTQVYHESMCENALMSVINYDSPISSDKMFQWSQMIEHAKECTNGHIISDSVGTQSSGHKDIAARNEIRTLVLVL
jgi:hypothetical protein